MISMAEVYIEIHESALRNMYSRAAILVRRKEALLREIDELAFEIEQKRIDIDKAKDRLLFGG